MDYNYIEYTLKFKNYQSLLQKARKQGTGLRYQMIVILISYNLLPVFLLVNV